jgi:hypothetical protein
LYLQQAAPSRANGHGSCCPQDSISATIRYIPQLSPSFYALFAHLCARHHFLKVTFISKGQPCENWAIFSEENRSAWRIKLAKILASRQAALSRRNSAPRLSGKPRFSR